jgi:hypothetical protein
MRIRPLAPRRWLVENRRQTGIVCGSFARAYLIGRIAPLLGRRMLPALAAATW